MGPVAAENASAGVPAGDRAPEAPAGPAQTPFAGGARLAEGCASVFGLAPAHPDLSTLAVFRTGYVARLPEGPEVLAEQDAADERIVAAILAADRPLAAILWAFVRDRLAEAAQLVRACELESAHLALAETRMTLAAALLEAPPPGRPRGRPSPRPVHPPAPRAVPDRTPTKGATR